MRALAFPRKLIKTIAHAFPGLSTIADYYWSTRNRVTFPALPQTEQLLAKLDEDGFAVVKDYWSDNKCARALGDIEAMIRERPDHVVRTSDIRVNGAEEFSSSIEIFHSDPMLQRISDMVHGQRTFCGFTLANKVESHPISKGSGEGWHKDMSFIQFKAFLYLNDVCDDCGPLQIIRSSHRLGDYLQDMRRGGLKFRHLRISDEQMEVILKADPSRLTTMSYPAGTLLLVNTGCIHRGKPPAGGVRYALTNYYYTPSALTEETLMAFRPANPGKARTRRDALLSSPSRG